MMPLKVGYAPQAKLSWINPSLEELRKRSIAAIEALGVEVVAGLRRQTPRPRNWPPVSAPAMDVMIFHYVTFHFGR